jgi:hypothetical protein
MARQSFSVASSGTTPGKTDFAQDGVAQAMTHQLMLKLVMSSIAGL